MKRPCRYGRSRRAHPEHSKELITVFYSVTFVILMTTYKNFPVIS